MATSNSAIPANVKGSFALTRNNRLDIQRVRKNADDKPITMPNTPTAMHFVSCASDTVRYAFLPPRGYARQSLASRRSTSASSPDRRRKLCRCSDGISPRALSIAIPEVSPSMPQLETSSWQ